MLLDSQDFPYEQDGSGNGIIIFHVKRDIAKRSSLTLRMSGGKAPEALCSLSSLTLREACQCRDKLEMETVLRAAKTGELCGIASEKRTLFLKKKGVIPANKGTSTVVSGSPEVVHQNPLPLSDKSKVATSLKPEPTNVSPAAQTSNPGPASVVSALSLLPAPRPEVVAVFLLASCTGVLIGCVGLSALMRFRETRRRRETSRGIVVPVEGRAPARGGKRVVYEEDDTFGIE